VFFSHFEPVYVFGRAGQMTSTGDIASYGVYVAARQSTYGGAVQVIVVRLQAVQEEAAALRAVSSHSPLLTRLAGPQALPCRPSRASPFSQRRP
jgi:hypothetical protein